MATVIEKTTETTTVSVTEGYGVPRLAKFNRPDGYILIYGGWVVVKAWYRPGTMILKKRVVVDPPMPARADIAAEYAGNPRKSVTWVTRSKEHRVIRASTIRRYLMPACELESVDINAWKGVVS